MHMHMHMHVHAGEFAVLDALSQDKRLLCAVSFLFVENHDMRVNRTRVACSL